MLAGDRGLVSLYGTTPPRADATDFAAHAAATKLNKRLSQLPVDGVVVYDVQDEAERAEAPRPFPFLPTRDSRDYASLLRGIGGKGCIVYKCVAGMTPESWHAWLTETTLEHTISGLSLVGRATSRGDTPSLSLLSAMREAREHPAGFCVGGVVIPERHGKARSESARLLQKMAAGCAYFISQAVYSPEAVIDLCRDYARDCEEQGTTPRRIVLTFTPCGRPKTLEFMEWLGITIPDETQQRLVSATDMLEASISVCRENLQRIFDAGIHDIVPIGINVESVSISRAEIAGTIELYQHLDAVAKSYIR